MSLNVEDIISYWKKHGTETFSLKVQKLIDENNLILRAIYPYKKSIDTLSKSIPIMFYIFDERNNYELTKQYLESELTKLNELQTELQGLLSSADIQISDLNSSIKEDYISKSINAIKLHLSLLSLFDSILDNDNLDNVVKNAEEIINREENKNITLPVTKKLIEDKK